MQGGRVNQTVVLVADQKVLLDLMERIYGRIFE